MKSSGFHLSLSTKQTGCFFFFVQRSVNVEDEKDAMKEMGCWEIGEVKLSGRCVWAWDKVGY